MRYSSVYIHVVDVLRAAITARISRLISSPLRGPKRLAAAQLSAILGLAFLGSYLPRTAAAACIEEGGTEFCRAPVPSDWSMGYCPMTGTFTYVDVAQCEAAGGEWEWVDGYFQCVGGTPVTEANLVQQVTAFEQNVNDDASCGIASDSGWGQTLPDNILCWSGPPRYKNNLLIGDFRVFTATCWPTVYARKDRTLFCPKGYSERTLSNGDLTCIRTPECCEVGTTRYPITHGSGVKLLRETDYQTPDGVRFERYYNSIYFFVPRSAAGDELRDMGMNWRTNYSKRIYPISGSQFVSAATTYEGGAVQYFDAAGNEIVSYQRSRVRLITTAQGYELHKGDDSIEYYDAAGRLLTLRARSGVTQSLAYSDGSDGSQTGLGGYLFHPNGNPTTFVMPAGWLVKVTDSYGRALSFGYDVHGRIARVTLPDGGVLKYQYDNSGNLTQVTKPDATQRTYAYNEAGYRGTSLPNALTGVIDENNVRQVSYYYDSSGRAYKEVFPSVGTNTNFHQLTFNPSALTSTVTDPLGAVRTYQFETTPYGLLRLVQESQPAASGTGVAVSSRTYDTNGNLASRTDFNGNTTTYVYDAARNVEVSRTEGSGTPRARTITTQWHPTYYLPTLITEPGRTTAFTHDASGNLLTRTITDTATGEVRTWTYTYDSLGKVLTADGPRTDVTDVTAYTYHECATGYQCGQIATVTDAAGNPTEYLTYNAHGQPLTIRDPNGVVTALTYDAQQRLKTRTVGTETTVFAYDPRGLPQRTTLPDGSYLQYTYDAANRLTDIVDGVGNSIHYTLDAAGNRVQEAMYDPNGVLALTRSQTFDVLGRLSAELGSANQTVSYIYDNNGNLLSRFDAVGNLTENVYDELNRLSTVIDAASGLTNYEYDGRDNLTAVVDPRQLTTSYQYNGFDDQTQLTSPDTGITQYTPNAAGNPQQSTDARGRVGIYSYDGLGRVLQITYADQVQQFTYDQGVNGKGRLTQISDDSGSTEWSYDIHGRPLAKQQVVAGRAYTVNYGYSAAGQLATITTPSGQVISYGYANGRISTVDVNAISVLGQVTYAPFGAATSWLWGNGTATVRAYNTDGQLVTVSSAGTSTYTFDLDGSIASREDDFSALVSLPLGLTTVTTAPTSNRLTATAGVLSRSYSYDAAGNTLSDGQNTFVYNDAGRLISSDNGTNTTQYLYNALGQRVRKSNSSGTTYFVYDEQGRLLGEYDAQGTLIQEIVWVDDIPVATIQTDQSGQGVGLFYIHTDHLNAPARLTEPANNAVVWRWDHDPFGNGAPNQDPDANGQTGVFNLRFPGQYYDEETGLHYNYFRDYDPVTGRFVQSDPLGLRAGLNTYNYTGANPLAKIDPLGLVEWKGTGSALSVIEGGGAIRFKFDLKSECVNGKQARASVVAGGFALGAGFRYTGTSGSVTFVDGNSIPDPFVFDGPAKYMGFGFAPADAGASYSRLHLGDAKSSGWSEVWGLDFSFYFGAGISHVQSASVEDCCEGP